jgi:septal ring factor EnvC (AmiA/AmiB activator)
MPQSNNMPMYASLKQVKRMLILFTLCLAASASTHAKDITNQQRNAYEARQEYHQNKSDYESLESQISQQEKYLADQQRKLDKLNADKERVKAKLDQSKKRLDAEVKALNQLWDQRDK